ncbi:MAG: YraN family protein [Alteromonas sp.]
MSSPKSTSGDIGADAETRAQVFLERQGLQFITRNYRCKCGEIDMIFKQQNTWIFVEVKYRSKQVFGDAIEQLSYHKQRKVLNAVRVFLLDNHLNEYHTSIRIDFIALTDTSIEWIKNVTG